VTGDPALGLLNLVFILTLGAMSAVAAPVHEAAQTGDLAQLQKLLADDATLLHAPGPMGTPLHHALFGHQLELARYLLENGADVDAAGERTGFTPLHASVYCPDQRYAELLVRYGAAVSSRGVRGFAPLDLAILFGKTGIAVLLIEHGADLTTTNGQGRLPLCQAAELGRLEIVEALLAAGAAVDARDERGTMPLQAAASRGRDEIVAQLLAHGARGDVIEPTSGRSLLQQACLNGHANIVEQLLVAGAPVEHQDASGHTALYYAGRYGHEQVANLLLEHGAQRPSGLVENYGRSPYLTRAPAPDQAVAWYLNHRGWAVKTRDRLLVFDAEEFGVTRPTQPSLANGFLSPGELAGQDLLSLFTCYHGDPGELAYVHTLADHLASAAYVHLEEDRFRDGQRCVYLSPEQRHEFDGVTVRTIDAFSGNATLAYLVETSGLRIFYLGFNVEDPARFVRDVDTLAATLDGVDLAFLPIPDPESGDGVLHPVVAKLRPRAVCLLDPNRREQQYRAVADALAATGYGGEVFCAEHPGDVFIYQGTTRD